MRKTTTLFYWLTLGFLSVGISSCSELNDLDRDLSDLDKRIEALEARMEVLNKNVEALQQLTQATTVNSVTFEDNVYTILLSDGQTLTLTVGEAGVGNVPLVTVDEEGYWMIDYQDGAGPVYLTGEKEKIPSAGKDAVTPVFGIDAEGYWTLDYGNGPKPVEDASGNKVPATSSDEVIDPVFEEVVYDKASGMLTVTLRADGRVIELPVVPDFLFAVKNAEGLQLFDYGETKVFPVESTGIRDAVIQTPSGWSAVLEEAAFSITAPAKTRSIPIADSDTDVVIVAQSSKGKYISVSKVRVSLSDAEIDIEPKVTVALEEAPLSTSLAFHITLEEATSYKYILRKSRETAPTYDEVKDSGLEAMETTLRVEELAPKTDYTLYVIACNGDILGKELVTLSAVTAIPDYASYHEAYEGGAELEIGGVVVSKTLFGESTLLTAEESLITADGVYFVPEGVTARYDNGAGKRGTLIIIGDNPAARSDFAFVGTVTRIEFDPAQNGSFMLYNLNFRVATDNGQGQILFYPNNENGGTMQNVVCESCRLDLSGLQGFSFTTDTRSADKMIRLNRVAFVDCDICVGSDTRFGYFFQYRTDTSFGDFIFRNNVVWSSSADNAARLLNGSKSTSAADFAKAAPVDRFEMENNTWIHCKGMPLNYVRSVGEYVLRNNLFYGKLTQYTPVMRYSETSELDGSPQTGAVYDNLGYVTGGASVCWKAANPNELTLPGYQQIINSKEDPFSGGTFDVESGIFIPNSTCASYGAQR